MLSSFCCLHLIATYQNGTDQPLAVYFFSPYFLLRQKYGAIYFLCIYLWKHILS